MLKNIKLKDTPVGLFSVFLIITYLITVFKDNSIIKLFYVIQNDSFIENWIWNSVFTFLYSLLLIIFTGLFFLIFTNYFDDTKEN